MKTYRLNNHTLILFDNIEDLPVVRFNKFNKFLLIDSGIGGNLEDIDVHIERIGKYIQIDDKKSATQELLNMRQAMYFITQEVSPKHLAFASLIYSVDGQVVTNVSDDILRELVNRLNDIKQSDISSILSEVKKK